MAGFSVTISAVDQTTATLDKINKRLKAFSAPYEKLNASLKTFGDVSGLNKVGKALGDIGSAAGGAFRSITRVVEPLGIIAGATSIAGVVAMAAAWAEWGSRLGYTAERIGTTAGRLNDLQNAARLAGVSAEAMTGGMTHLKDAMTDALAGRNNEAMQYFQRLGISMRALHGTAESVLPQIVAKIGQLEKTNPTLAARVTSAMFGSEELLRLFRGGLPAFRAYLDQAQKLGGVTDDQVKKADQLRQSQTALTVSVEQFGYTLAAGLQPVIGPVLDYMTNWLATNKDWLANTITEDVKDFIGYLKSLDWHKIKQDFDGWYDSVTRVVDKFGGLQAVVRDLLLLMAGSFVLKLTSPFFVLAGALDGVIFKMGKMVLAARAAQAAAVAATTGEAVAGGTAAAGAATAGEAAVAGASAGGEAAAGTAAGAAGFSGLGLGVPLLIGAAVTGTVAYLTAHGLSWLFGGGWNDPGAKGPTANAANRGHDRNQEIHSSSGPRRGGVAALNGLAKQDIADFMSRGLSRTQANILEGNLAQESGLQEDARNPKSGAYGLAQWLGKRVDDFQQVEGNSLSNSTRAQQRDFIMWELNHSESAAGKLLRAQTDERTGAVPFGQAYERYGADEEGNRAGYAQQFAALPMAGGPPATMPTRPAPGTDGANGKVEVVVRAEDGTSARVHKAEGSVQASAPKGVAKTLAGSLISM